MTQDHEDDASVEVTYGYDDPTAGRFGLGRLTSVGDQSGDLELDYDERGRTVAMRRTLDFDSTLREEESTCDEQDRLVTQRYPDGSVASDEYVLDCDRICEGGCDESAWHAQGGVGSRWLLGWDCHGSRVRDSSKRRQGQRER